MLLSFEHIIYSALCLSVIVYVLIRIILKYGFIKDNVIEELQLFVLAVGVLSVINLVLIWRLLPTCKVVNGTRCDEYYDRFALNSDFFDEVGKSYICNNTKDTFYLLEAKYGYSLSKDENSDVTLIHPGKIRVEESNIKMFSFIQESIRTKNGNETVWYLLTKEKYMDFLEDLELKERKNRSSIQAWRNSIE